MAKTKLRLSEAAAGRGRAAADLRGLAAWVRVRSQAGLARLSIIIWSGLRLLSALHKNDRVPSGFWRSAGNRNGGSAGRRSPRSCCWRRICATRRSEIGMIASRESLWL